MPRCEFIALPRSDGGHIPDMIYGEDEDVCQTQHCKNPTSTINFHEGDAPREYCEECYKVDQDDDDE